jgi:hypothetical protein
MTNIRPSNFRPSSIPGGNLPHAQCINKCPTSSIKMPIYNTEHIQRKTSFVMETARNIKIYSKLKGKKYNTANKTLNQYLSWAGAPHGYGAPIKNKF